HVLLVGKGAEIFAEKEGLEIVDTSYFYTPGRWKSLENAREKEKNRKKGEYDKFSTVGAVALDMHGNLAAGTSTGGMTNKMFGRIGDSPIIGAGTYADNKTCAVSATGHGEYFIRNVVAYDISALMKYRGWPLEKASEYVIMDKLVNIGAGGGIIAVDYNGNVAMDFNTISMMRGVVREGEEMKIYLLEE
ncbi:isoaspartyl peptidase/L-asparaginase family protein, partial [Bacteroidota bacterium]